MNILEWQMLKSIGFVCAGLLKDYTKKMNDFPVLDTENFLKITFSVQYTAYCQ